MNLKKSVCAIYDCKPNITESEMKRGRTLYIVEGVTARCVFVLTSGAFLAGFAKLMGADDSFNGILGAIPTLAGTIQLLSPMVLERLRSRKLIVAILCFVHRFLLAFMIFIPLFVQNTTIRLYLLLVISLFSYSALAFMSPAASNWMVSLTDSKGRGSYFGKRDSILLGVSTVLSLVAGKILDIYRSYNLEYSGFIVIAIILITFTFINFGLLSNIPEPEVKLTKALPRIKDVFIKPLQNADFKKVIIITILWNIALQIGVSFFSVYMVSGLDLNYSYITAMTTLGSIIAVFSARLYGKLADRTSWAFVTKLSIGVLGACHLLWTFVCKSNVYFLLPFAQFLSGAAWGGINIAIFNIQFKYAPEEGRTMYLGFNAAAGGCIGFAVAMVGAKIVSALDGFSYIFLGISFGKMQVVFGLSAILLFVCSYTVGMLFKEEIRDGNNKYLLKELIEAAILKLKIR